MPRTLDTQRHRVLVETLIELRVRAGMTQAELADKLGRYQSVVAAIESGGRRIDLIELFDIVEALGADIETVIQRVRELRL